jgi:hypothetical protein
MLNRVVSKLINSPKTETNITKPSTKREPLQPSSNQVVSLSLETMIDVMDVLTRDIFLVFKLLALRRLILIKEAFTLDIPLIPMLNTKLSVEIEWLS